MFRMVSFKGAVDETFVNWTSDWQIDQGAMQAQVDFQVDSGIKGLFGIGMATEPMTMGPGQKVEYIKNLVACAKGRVPVMANILESSTKEALDAAKKYEDAGADAICITQPLVMPPEPDALRRHFETIIESTEKPVGIYNMPQSGYKLSPEFVADLANKYEHVVYYKNSTQDMVHFQTCVNLNHNPNFEYLEGSDGTILATMVAGGHGVISGISMAFPKLIVELCDLCLAGAWDKAREVNKTVIAIRNINKKVNNGFVFKYLCDLFGNCPGGRSKPPMSDLTDAQKDYLKAEYTKLGFLK